MLPPREAPAAAHLTVRWGNATVVATQVALAREPSFLDGAVRIEKSDAGFALVVVPVSGAAEVRAAILPERRQRVFAGPFTIVVDTETEAQVPLVRRALVGARALVADGASFALHVTVIAIVAFFADPLAPHEPLDLSHLVDAVAEAPRPSDEEDLSGAAGVIEGANVSSAAPEGASGSANDTVADRGIPVPGPRGADRTPESYRSRDELLADAASFGIISLVRTADARMASPWNGADDLASAGGASGIAWGNTLGEGLGYGGLGLLGIGEGAGGKGAGAPWGGSGGGLGFAGATCDDQCMGAMMGHGMGRGTGARLGGSHRTRAPVVRCGAGNAASAPADDKSGPMPVEGPRLASASGGGGCVASVVGRLPPEVIQRVVRQNFGRMKACYQTQTDTQGRVTVRFVIQRDGSVGGVRASGEGVRDSLASCVGKAFGAISFPQPEGGVVTVAYPIVFSPE